MSDYTLLYIKSFFLQRADSSRMYMREKIDLQQIGQVSGMRRTGIMCEGWLPEGSMHSAIYPVFGDYGQIMLKSHAKIIA